MNALYVICGLGFLSLLAEIANLKKGLTAAILPGFMPIIDRGGRSFELSGYFRLWNVLFKEFCGFMPYLFPLFTG